METESIKQTVTFNAPSKVIYNMLMDQQKHAEFTGTSVIMSAQENGKFSIFDGYCHGRNIELIEGEKIVQAWNFKEDGWPDDHYSVCTFNLKTTGNQTKLVFLQTGVPKPKVESLKEGWKQFYWKPMKEYLMQHPE